MEKIIIDLINKTRKNSKRPYSESIWTQMQKDGHKFDFNSVEETLRAMQFAGLIENRPYKGEESFYVIDGAAAVSICEDEIRKEDDNISITSTNMVESDCQKKSQTKFTPYEEFVALRHMVIEMQDTVRSSCSSSEVATKDDIEQLKKENEFLKNELRRKNLIIESLQATPLPDPKLQYGEGLDSFGEGFIFPQRKHVARQHIANPWLPKLYNFDNRFTPLDNYVNRDLESDFNANESVNKGAPTKANHRSAANNNPKEAKNQNSENTYSKAVKTGTVKKTNTPRKSEKRKVYILGDSMIKGIQHWKMQSQDTQVVVRSFSGAKIKQMRHYVKPAEAENRSLYILHVGTNDLRESKSAEKIANEIVNLASTLKNGKNEVTVSGICPREDNLNDKAGTVNEILAKCCQRHKLGFIKHQQLDAKKHTNTSKLHLNKEGNYILQRSFQNEIQI